MNGHKNWNHWNVSLWINKDEGLYRLAQRIYRFEGAKRKAAKCIVESLRLQGITHTPDGAPYNVTNVAAAL